MVYYSSGNFEAFARPRKPVGVDGKTAWIVGGGLAGLSSAVFLIRDGHMPGHKITVLERTNLPGGAMDGADVPEKGWVIRGNREMDDHFECLWDLFRSIPSLETKDASVLDEMFWLGKDDPNFSLQRATINQGQDAHTDGKFGLCEKAQKELMTMFLATRKEMENRRINEVFTQEFFDTNFWMYWRTMFAFEEWHSALEMKLYLHRFIHHIDGFPDMSALKFTRYNQYESMILPMVSWLKDQGVVFRYGIEVTDVDFDIQPTSKQATRINWKENGVAGGVDLGSDDLVFMTIGSLVDNSDEGDHHTAARLNEGPAPAWDLWRRIAAKDRCFGRPDVFGSNIAQTKWESATVTTLDKRIPEYIHKITKRDPFSGRIVSGGIVTVKDSNWLMSWLVERQPHFKKQPKDQVVAWIYSLFVDRPGNFVKKPMQDCTGEEITQEWLYHMGVPVEDIPDMAATAAKTVPVMMPYITAFFMPRQAGDRPDVVPQGARNFAFIGQFAESRQPDCIFTIEYSTRTAMEAVYELLGVERGVPEVFNSTYDIRTLLHTLNRVRDGQGIELPGPEILRKLVMNKLDETVIGELLKNAHLIAK